MLPSLHVLYLIKKHYGPVPEQFAVSVKDKVQVLFPDVGYTLILKVDEQHFLHGMSPSHQLLYVLIQHVRLASPAHAHQHIVGVFLKRHIPPLQLYATDKLLLA